MTVWLGPDQVAERLGVKRKTALSLMRKMRYTVVSGVERQRIRVTEAALEDWMEERTNGGLVRISRHRAMMTDRRLQRR